MSTQQTSAVVYSRGPWTDITEGESILTTSGVNYQRYRVSTNLGAEARLRVIGKGLGIERPHSPVIIFRYKQGDDHEGVITFINPREGELDVLRTAAEHHQSSSNLGATAIRPMKRGRSDVIDYSRPLCSDCIVVKEKLGNSGIIYQDSNVREDRDAQVLWRSICRGLDMEEPRLPTVVFRHMGNAGEDDGFMIFVEPQGGELKVMQAAIEYHRPSGRLET